VDLSEVGCHADPGGTVVAFCSFSLQERCLVVWYTDPGGTTMVFCLLFLSVSQRSFLSLVHQVVERVGTLFPSRFLPLGLLRRF
jgi:hypothetical protein